MKKFGIRKHDIIKHNNIIIYFLIFKWFMNSHWLVERQVFIQRYSLFYVYAFVVFTNNINDGWG